MSRRHLVAAVVAGATLAACSAQSATPTAVSNSAGPSSASAATTPRASTPPATSPAATAASPTSSGATVTTIKLTFSGHTLTAQLNDSATARDLASRLPLNIPMTDYGQQEKQGPIAPPLSTDGAPASSAADAGDIAFYTPHQVIVFFYRGISAYPGVIPIGHVDAKDLDAIRSMPDGTTLEIARA